MGSKGIGKPWVKWTTISLVAIIAIVAAAMIRLPHITGRIASAALGVEVTIGGLRVSPVSKTIVITDLAIAQPAGFTEEPMMTVGAITVSGWSGLLSDHKKIDEITIDAAYAFILTDDEGETNLNVWIRSMGEGGGGGGGEEEEGETSDEEPSGLNAMLGRLVVNNITVDRRDLSIGEHEFLLQLTNGQLLVERFVLGSFEGLEPGTMNFDARILQSDTESAHLSAAARFGAFGTTDDIALRVSLRGTGFLYRTFVPVIPANTDTILGGDGFDTSLEASIADGHIDARSTALTSRKGNYVVTVGGTLEAANVKLPEKLGAVASRMTGGAGRIVGSALHGSGALVSGAVKTAGAVGKGVLGAAGSILKGAGSAAVGVATLDSEAASEGLGKMTVGAGGELVDAVGDSASEIGEAGKRTGDKLANDPALQKWIQEIPARHRQEATGLLKTLQDESFPPEITAADSQARNPEQTGE